MELHSSSPVWSRSYRDIDLELQHSSPVWRRVYLVSCIAIFIVFAVLNLTHPLVFSLWTADAWEHAAALRALLTDPLHPPNPHLHSDESSARFGPVFVLLAFIGRAAGLDQFALLTIYALFNMAFFLAGNWLFLRRYFASEVVPLIGLFIFLFAWGSGNFWTGYYSFYALQFNAYTPSGFAVSGVFWLLWGAMLAEDARQGGRAGRAFAIMALCGLFAAMLLLVHPLAGTFSLGTLMLFLALRGSLSLAHRVQFLLVVAVAASSTALIWPYYSLLHAMFGDGGWEDPAWRWSFIHRIFYAPYQVLHTLGPIVLSLPLFVYYALRRQHLFSVIGGGLMLFFYSLDLFVSFPLGHRFLSFFCFYAHLLMIAASADLIAAWPALGGRARRALAVSGAALAVLLVAGQSAHLARDYLSRSLMARGMPEPVPHLFRWYRLDDISGIMKQIAAVVPPEAVVIAPKYEFEEDINFVMPAFTGKVVLQERPNPLVDTAAERAQANRRFFSPGTSAEERQAILRRYDVRFIAYRPGTLDAAVMQGLAQIPGRRRTVALWEFIEVAR